MSVALNETAVGEASAPGTVEVTREVRASAEEVWRALTEPDSVARWFGTLATELRLGVGTILNFHDGDFFLLLPLQLHPPHSLQYVWRFLGIGPLDTITWRLVPHDGGCLVTVTDAEPERGAEEAAALREGWLDFTRRLKKYLETGKPVRYAWRHEFDGSVELRSDGDLWGALFGEGREAAWLPLSGPSLADGSQFIADDGASPRLLQIENVHWDPPRSVRFHLTHSDWARPTPCRLELTPRPWGALLSVNQSGWKALRSQRDYGRVQRKRLSAQWISALLRARLMIE